MGYSNKRPACHHRQAFQGHKPCFRLLLEELWFASSGFKIARIAAARKLLLIAHTVYKSNEQFRVSEGVQT
jgi:hypothetical protein